MRTSASGGRPSRDAAAVVAPGSAGAEGASARETIATAATAQASTAPKKTFAIGNCVAATGESMAGTRRPARTEVTNSTVSLPRPAGTAASSTATCDADSRTPRRTIPRRSFSAPRDNQDLSVPSGQPSSRAASVRDMPRRWQCTSGNRYRSGNRDSSSSRIPPRSKSTSRESQGGVEPAASRSCRCLRSRLRRSVAAIRVAATCNQAGNEVWSRNRPASRASARNVVWKASSASAGSGNASRQTRQTSGPYRPTRAASASASPVSANSSRSSRSLRSDVRIPATSRTISPVGRSIAFRAIGKTSRFPHQECRPPFSGCRTSIDFWKCPQRSRDSKSEMQWQCYERRVHPRSASPASLKPSGHVADTSARTPESRPMLAFVNPDRRCPKCSQEKPLFRSRRPVETENGLLVETKYRCRDCNHEFRERIPAPPGTSPPKPKEPKAA